jgi:hypothetical protein
MVARLNRIVLPMNDYVELLHRIVVAYHDTRYGFRSPEAAEKIDLALTAFEPAFEELASVIDRQRRGEYTDPKHYVTASRNALRTIDARQEELASSSARAVRADRAKVARAIVDQGLLARRAQLQKAADGAMLDQVDKLVGQCRADVKAAAEIPPAGVRAKRSLHSKSKGVRNGKKPSATGKPRPKAKGKTGT